MADYDAWLERPYQADDDSRDCPECGAPVIEDKAERSVECTKCSFSDGFDWDAEAERRAEARELDYEDRLE